MEVAPGQDMKVNGGDVQSRAGCSGVLLNRDWLMFCMGKRRCQRNGAGRPDPE